jgi:hypothetical protein
VAEQKKENNEQKVLSKFAEAAFIEQTNIDN